MKRILVIGLCIVMAIGVVGCSKNKSEGNGDKENTVVEENGGFPEVVLFGKIKKIVGNQIELEIAKDPSFGDTYYGDSSSGEVGEGDVITGEVEVVEGTITSEASSGSDASNSDDMLGMLEQEEYKLELEYVGETKELTIPAGVKIFNLKTGKNENLSALKSGSVIRIYADGTVESPSIINLDIVE